MEPTSSSLAHRDAVVETDLRAALLRLAWPAVLATGARATFAIADPIWVGKGLGSGALAAVSTASFVLWSVEAVTLAVSVGLSAVVARRVGEGDSSATEHVVRQGLMLAVVASIFVGLGGYAVSEDIFRLMGTSEDVSAAGVSYLRVLFLGVASLFGFATVEAVFRGTGDTRTPLLLLLGACAVNLVVDPVLILGLGPVPRLGVAGAALATVLSQTLVTVAGLVLLWRRGLLRASLLRDWLPRLLTWMRILRVGAPAAINGVFFCSVYVVLARITAGFGTDAIAALGIGHKGEAPAYFLSLGFGLAVAPLVGQCLGAGRPERAQAAVWMALRMAGAWGLAWSAVLAIFPRLVASAFIDDPAVLDIAEHYLLILSWTQVLMIVELICDGAFAGAGDTVPPMVVGLPLAAARIPLAYWLSGPLGMGVDGIWWAIAVTAALRGIFIAAWFRRGGWKTRVLR